MNPLKYFKVFNKEPCPCGSGKTYLECCKNRTDRLKKPSKKPLDIQLMEQFRKSQIKCCLHPDTPSCVKHIKEAHALQNNKIISQLSEDGHVYILNPQKPPLIIPIENEEPEVLTIIDHVGVNHATTATCFCDIHDDEVFAPIEKGAPAFNREGDEHKYIYAYKAFIFEYYKKLVQQKAFLINIKDTPSLLRNTQFIRYYRSISLTLQEMKSVKEFFDSGIVRKDYTGLSTCVIEFPERINFANYACIAIDFDLNGKKIRHTKRGFISRLFITIFPEDTKSYIILSCLNKDLRIYRKFFQQIQKTNPDKIKYYFDLILPLYTENIVFSPLLWEKWDEERKMAYTFYANRKDKQFMIYNQILKFGIYNLRKRNNGFGEGNRGKLDLFE